MKASKGADKLLYSETKTYFHWAKHNFIRLIMLIVMHVFLSFILVVASFCEPPTISLILWVSYSILEILWLIICLSFFKNITVHNKNYLTMVGNSLKIFPRVILLAIVLISIIILLLIGMLGSRPDPIGQMLFIPVFILVIIFLISMFAYVPVLFINQNIKFFKTLKASINLAWVNKWAISLNILLCMGYKFISIQILLPKSYIIFILNDGIITALLFNYMLGLLHFNYMKHLYQDYT